jgi:hypothetical protein
MALASRLSAAPRLPRVPAAQSPAPSSGQLWGHHVSPWLRLPLPARDSSGDIMCPRSSGSPSRLGAAPEPPRVLGLCGLQSSKQISFSDSAIMISIGTGGSSNADKTCGSPIAVTHHSAERFNDSGPHGYCSRASATWATCQLPLWA